MLATIHNKGKESHHLCMKVYAFFVGCLGYCNISIHCTYAASYTRGHAARCLEGSYLLPEAKLGEAAYY